MTRAEKGLYLTEAEGRNFDGSPRYPSRFLLDIDPALLTYTEKPREGLIAEARDYIAYTERFLSEDAHTPRFAVGQRVKHSVFGTGVILDVDTAKSAYLVQFDEIPTPRSISFKVKLNVPV